jgi:geranyl-CoA carboxylase alpha subunit
MKAINTLLIANRGEIAVRIVKTARRLGIKTVAVFSEPDADALHVKMADCAVALNGSTPLESYLSIDKIIDACRKTNADAVHPGYGFLSENAEFARACLKHDITFVGPSVDAINAMGHKSRAKELMAAAGVPSLPGYSGKEQSLDFLFERGKEVGYPLMIKAAAGGGGRGLRIAASDAELRDLMLSARSEAERAFGSGELLLERALFNVRHVEVQVFGDRFGNVVHLGERDCSIQRRHQKVFEESPCPQVTEALREEMGNCAVRAARAIDYVGAGTIEFLLDRDNKYYFLEMNTRLQVEHPVTECVTGVDLVEWQLRVAAGEKLPLGQSQIKLQGHAIEARLYAEDPDNQFQPQIGEIVAFNPPADELARCDSGLNPRDNVSPFYDAMLAKVICHGEDRESAVRKLKRALGETTVFGIKTNRDFLIDCLGAGAFAEGDFDTGFIQGFWHPAERSTVDMNLVAMAAALIVDRNSSGIFKHSVSNKPIDELIGWSSSASMSSLMKLSMHDGCVFNIEIRFLADRRLEIEIAGEKRLLTPLHIQCRGNSYSCQALIDGVSVKADFQFNADEIHISSDARTYVLEDVLFKPAAPPSTVSDGEVVSPTNGLLASVDVKVDDVVERGAPLFTVDAMKLLQTITAPLSGRVIAVLAEAGQQIKSKQLIVQIEEDAEVQDTGSGASQEKSLAVH